VIVEYLDSGGIEYYMGPGALFTADLNKAHLFDTNDEATFCMDALIEGSQHVELDLDVVPIYGKPTEHQ
jgi:hypothetical protein